MVDDAVHRWLLAIDGSPHADSAARYVAEWSKPLGVEEVYVLNAQPIGSYRAYALHHDEMVLEASERGANATAIARQLLDRAGVRYRFHTDMEDVADAIVRRAQGEHADEIVMGTRGLGAVASLVLGSVAYKVAHLAEVPLTLCRANGTEPAIGPSTTRVVHSVLLAYDGSPEAHRAVKYVGELRRRPMQVDVHLVNVQMAVRSAAPSTHVVHEVVDSEARARGEQLLEEAERLLTGERTTVHRHVVAGYLAEALVHTASAHHCTRMVLGSRGLGAIASIALGSVAYKVIHLAPIPVTLVK